MKWNDSGSFRNFIFWLKSVHKHFSPTSASCSHLFSLETDSGSWAEIFRNWLKLKNKIVVYFRITQIYFPLMFNDWKRTFSWSSNHYSCIIKPPPFFVLISNFPSNRVARPQRMWWRSTSMKSGSMGGEDKLIKLA